MYVHISEVVLSLEVPNQHSAEIFCSHQRLMPHPSHTAGYKQYEFHQHLQKHLHAKQLFVERTAAQFQSKWV